MKKSKTPFFQLAQDAKKILVLDLGFLGDTVQLIPALNCIRHSLPHAQLDVMVCDHIKEILELTPWINNVLGYPRYPKGPKFYQDIGRVLKLRLQQYDAIINLNGSDRSSLLTWAIGAPLRLGRIQKVLRWFTPFCFTHITFYPFDQIPVYQQHLNCLEYAGFPKMRAFFNTTIPEKIEARIAQALDHETDFIHVAPFTSKDSRNLSLALTADLLKYIHTHYPEKKLVLTCSPTEREKTKLEALLNLLPFEPWRVFKGNLTMNEVAAIIDRASILIGGDSGPMHVAVMMNTPTFIWFKRSDDHHAWKPEGAQHRSIFGNETSEGLQNITLEDLTMALDKMFHNRVFA